MYAICFSECGFCARESVSLKKTNTPGRKCKLWVVRALLLHGFFKCTRKQHSVRNIPLAAVKHPSKENCISLGTLRTEMLSARRCFFLSALMGSGSLGFFSFLCCFFFNDLPPSPSSDRAPPHTSFPHGGLIGANSGVIHRRWVGYTGPNNLEE